VRYGPREVLMGVIITDSEDQGKYDRFDRWFMPFACIAGSVCLVGILVWMLCNY
jgi:hypothetical protein